MPVNKRICLAVLAALLVLAGPAEAWRDRGERGHSRGGGNAGQQVSYGKSRGDRAARDFPHIDSDGDGQISRSEWLRRGNFDRLDRDASDGIDLDELRGLYRDAWRQPEAPPVPPASGPLDAEDGRVADSRLDADTRCGIGRIRRCGIEHSIDLGLLATGLGPRFPAGVECRGIDDYWALDYSFKRPRKAYHGGIDIPAPWGTPMLAVAAGTVVAVFDGQDSARGIEVVLRHSPKQTGLPVWVYTAYGHLDRMPDLRVGQPVAMGQLIGPTGNSGINPMSGRQSKRRRPAIHLAAFWSESPEYTEANRTIIPIDGHWLDPLALYRGGPPFDSQSLKELPETEKWVDIPVMFGDASTEPADTRLIWPYACRRD